MSCHERVAISSALGWQQVYIERSKSFVAFVSYVRQHGKENVKDKKEGNQSTQTNIRVRYKCNKLQHMQVLLRLKYIYFFLLQVRMSNAQTLMRLFTHLMRENMLKRLKRLTATLVRHCWICWWMKGHWWLDWGKGAFHWPLRLK